MLFCSHNFVQNFMLARTIQTPSFSCACFPIRCLCAWTLRTSLCRAPPVGDLRMKLSLCCPAVVAKLHADTHSTKKRIFLVFLLRQVFVCADAVNLTVYRQLETLLMKPLAEYYERLGKRASTMGLLEFFQSVRDKAQC